MDGQTHGQQGAQQRGQQRAQHREQQRNHPQGRPESGAGRAAAAGLGQQLVDLVVRPRRGGLPMSGLSALRAYWEALREGGGVPRRTQIHPRGIEAALDITFLAEQVAPRVARVRLAGQQVAALMGMDLRGMPLSALIAPDSRDAFGEALERVFAAPAVVEIAFRGEAGLTRPRLDARMLLLPLRAEDNSLTRSLGGLVWEGRIGPTPRRLEVTGVQVTPIPGVAASLPRGMASTPTLGLADPPAGFTPAPPAPRGRPKLRVIRNDD